MKSFPKRLSKKSEYASFSSRWACRQAGALRGIHGMAIPNALNAAQGHLDGNPFGAASFLLLHLRIRSVAFGCVAAEGQGPPGIDASATPCQKRKMPAATRILTYWTLSQKFFAILTLIFLALLTGCSRSSDEQTESRPPNIIFVYADNLGYGDIEPFGATTIRTPHLNRMAAEGRKFTHFCVTSGVCTPSRSSAMTGSYAQRVGMHWNDRDDHVLRPVSPYGLNPNEITVAEILKEQGYATTCIGKWHLGDQPDFLPTRQGFDSYYGIPYSDDMVARTWDVDGSVWPPLPLMENETVIEAPADRDTLTKRYTERALSFIEANRDKPFFLYMPQAMPGSTLVPYASEAFKGKSEAGPWGDSVEELDWSIGQILDKLVELELDTNTLVLWTSDNGSPMTRRPDSPYRGTNAPLFGRGYTTAEGAFRVPTIFWWPGKAPPGTVCNELSTTMDLLPTFARLAGAEPPTDRVIDGHDMRPLLFDEPGAVSPYDAFYYYQRDQLQAVRSGPWKLFLSIEDPIRHPHHPANQPGPTEPLLFNVVEDIGSERNRIADHPEIVQRLEALAEKARAELGDRGKSGTGQRPRGRVDNPQPQVLAR